MDERTKVSNLTVGELRQVIGETVWDVLEEFMQEVLANLPVDDMDFNDEDLYGDNGGE